MMIKYIQVKQFHRVAQTTFSLEWVFTLLSNVM